MGEYQKQKKVKLFCAILYIDKTIYTNALEILEKDFSKIDYISSEIPFSYTSYYQPEMGNQIYRLYLSFSELIYPYQLADIKKRTNDIENYFKVNSNRKINIDPGYISLSNLVLATTKNYSHRIAISPEIYAEVTLIYKKNSFNSLEWTYPDYKDPQNIIHFNNIRNILAKQLKENPN
jgi:CRISPR/Cas system CSM-associated protein Csm4 (group 5 of RAMP superfamily)